MKTHLFQNSIYTRFLSQLLLLVLIPISLVIIVFFYIYQQDHDSRYELNTSVSNSVITNINSNLEFTSRTTQSLLSSSDLISFLQNSYNMENDYDNYVSSIQNYVQATINVDPRSDISIYAANPSIPMSMDVFYHLADISGLEPIADFLSSNDIERWYDSSDFSGLSSPYLFSTDGSFVYMRKAYDFRKNFLGLIVLSIPEKYFLSYDTENESAVISRDHMRIINLTGEALPKDVLSEITSLQKTQMHLGSYLVTCEKTEDFPFAVTVVTKDSGYRLFLGIFIIALGAFALLCILLCLRNIKQMVRQMHLCLSAMDKSINNNYQTRVPVIGNNEIAHICRHINVLLDQAEDLTRQNVLKETSNKESRLIALQHQINPHFIYNTMEVFSSKMKLYGHYETSDAMIAFANIFRYNISTNDTLVMLREEITQIQNYMYIQKLRYPMLTLHINIPEPLNSACIPKFTFQPLIENAISHGITDSGQPLDITVEVRRSGDSLSFRLSDNGAGIPEEKLREINASLRSDPPSPGISSDGHSVGLKNVNTRLVLYFGKDSHLILNSLPGKGTFVSFSIPCTLNRE